MAIPVIAALLLHVVWLARSYQHANPAIMKWMRTTCAVSSLILTTALFCLVDQRVSSLASANFYFCAGSGARQVVSVTSSPDNSICYAEISNLDDNAK
ncbi:hypothetical protein [Pseudomonas sp. TWP3-2]|uniref:hypothetical protein n=1 Tax=Pseudomonas sp. TWP3-2 TaxID=2804574 RepID=UPI003CED5608